VSDQELLTAIAEASRRYGLDPQYVFGGGGNTSCKTSETLYIKPSGVSLATMEPTDFVPMNRAAITELFGMEAPDTWQAREALVKDAMLAAVTDGSGRRPSVESPLHDIIPYTYVVHTHSTLINGLTCALNGEAEAKRLFPDALWVPYIDPGYTLAVEMKKVLDACLSDRGEVPKVILLESHGIFVAADTIAEIDEIYETMIAAVVAEYEAKGISMQLATTEPNAETVREQAPRLRQLLSDGGFRKHVAAGAGFTVTAGPPTPDHVVYAKSVGYSGEFSAEGLAAFREQNGYLPTILTAADGTVFASNDDYAGTKLSLEAAENAALVVQLTAAFGGPRYLEGREREFIEQWEVESYRKKLAMGGGAKRLSGRVAIVTGAAQGFGFGIAEQLIAQGATIVVADINLEGAQAAADKLNEANGRKSAFAVAVNVSDEDSTKAMVDSVAKEAGGIDLLVCNAGVLRAGSVKEISLKDWQFVTNVNYTGYFLCVKAAAPVMAAQIVDGEGAWSDVVQVSSKSGLQGSNKNGAYAGSKFGGIGLTQSFAMELVADGIKVNSVCPGNFFDGPLWSDPDRGLFVMYLNTGKVPGAKTVEDVKRFYEAKVPMNRGCFPVDVARAILYCVEQQYETGQAIPVTGGQVMLK
jgi:NAD(P)-dependent dehydrogenase (short-subunit alcohol dehydrogenase family)/rhamnose utilization protein RhaD (predicted bifunctional aldolase and dehydrogenase)